MYGIGFYDEYLNRVGNLRDKPDMATPYKIEYLKKIIKNNKVYKYISFQENADIKIQTLKDNKIWFSFYKTLNDETEFSIDYKMKKVVDRTGYSKQHIEFLINYLTEMYDVFSLTYAYEDYMWDEYASNGNGVCIEYNIGNYDFLYPVEYCDKDTIDFTEMVINSLKNGGAELSIIPWVIKNQYNKTSNLDSTKEKEIRMLYCPYDLAEFNNGILEYDIKERMRYKGIAKLYTDFNMAISQIMIGSKCSEKIKRELMCYCETNKIKIEYV